MNYTSGSAKVNINPDQSILSLALAGYGAPYEGRFSLTWELLHKHCDVSSVISSGGLLYGLSSSGNVLKGSWEQNSLLWNRIGSASGLKAITFLGNRLLALNTQGEFLELDPKSNFSVDKTLISHGKFEAIVAVGNNLYAADSSGTLHIWDLNSAPQQWRAVGGAITIKHLTTDGERIYALDNDQGVWLAVTGGKIHWVKIARNNGYSVTQTLRQIFYFEHAFYAVTKDGELLKSSHSLKYDLYATAVAIGDGDRTAVVVGLDCTGFDFDFIKEVKSAVTAKTGIPAEALLINASHTHFAPVTQNWHTWQEFYQKPDQKYLYDYVKNGVIEAIITSLSDMVPVTISFLRGSTRIGYNRRNNVHSNAIHDNSLDVLKISDQHNKLKQIIYLAACHPVFKNADENSPFTLSSNFPGVCREITEQAHQADVLFLQGFAGDVNPVNADYEHTGKQLGAELNNLLLLSGEILEGKISYAFHDIKVGLDCLNPEEFKHFHEENKREVDVLSLADQPANPVGQFVLTPLMEKRKNLRWVALMEKKSAAELSDQAMPVYVQVINIGAWKLLGLSREVVSDYAEPLRSLWPDQNVSLAAYCNDVSSYLPCDWHILRQTYEGYDSFYWYGSPGIPAVDVKNDVIEQIHNLNL